MKFFKYIGYFSQLRKIIGLRGTSIFTLVHVWNKINPPRNGELAHISVGEYVFYFPSLAYFEGLFTEIFFKETYYLAQTQKPIQVIDCGANIGMSLLYIKIRAPKARVICFEPNPAARAVLEKNIAANNWGKEVQVFPYALGKERGSADFFVDDAEATSSGGSTAHFQKNKNQKLNSYTVKVEMLSHYINDSIDFLKIDIEGTEFDVLEELASIHKLDSIVAIQFEYHHIPGFFTKPLSEILTLLESAGFHTFVESNTPPHKIIGCDAWHTYMVFAWR